MNLCEWNIKTTSNKCFYRVLIREFDCCSGNCQSIPKNECSEQCDHPENASRTCKKSLCPEKLKKNKMNSFLKTMQGGNLTITEAMFQEVTDKIGHFTKQQIMDSDLPVNLLFEIADGGWDDTCQIEQIMDHLAQKYIGMSWPLYGDPDSVQEEFKKRLKEFKEK